MRILANLNVVGTLDLDNVANAAADTDRFLVQDANGVVKYRTGAEVASDIGAAVGYVSTVKHEVKLAVAVGKGKAVYVSGSDGTNMLASLASNASEATSTKTLGLTESAGAQNAKVFVVSEGLLAGLDTSTATIGDPVWLGVDGELVYGLNNKPYAPAHMVFVGLVTRVNANNGEIFVKVQNGFELQELHNVQITTTPANNTVLSYETSSSLYKMKSIATLLGYTPADDAGVVHLAGTETISGTKTFTATTTTFAKVVANSPAGGATGEGLVVGSSFKLDASGEGQSAKIYVVTKDLSDTYGSGLQIQFANIDDNKGFGFNLNTAGGYELYTKDAGAAWVKAMTISNAQLATFHGNVRLANYTTNGFVKTSSSNGTITIDPAAFTLTTTGTNGPATYNSGTGILNIPEYLGASGIRIVYNFTATAGQTTFTVTSYTPGVIDVFYNGSRLNEDEYTATNGTTIVFDTACAVGDLVDIIVYQGSINGFTGVGGSGTINQLTYWNGANTIAALSTTTYPSLTEISYVKGVTSAIQTQLDAKVPTSRTLTINGTSYDLSANRSWTISGVTGSGTANQIAYWDGSSSVAGSTFLTQNLTADNGYLILTGGATYKNADIWLNRYSDAWENAIRFQTNGTTDWYLGSSATGSNSNLEFFSYGTSSAALTLLRSSANANFGASVGVGSTTLTGYSLRVSRTMVGDTASGITSFGVVSDGTIQAAVTSGAFGFNSSLSTAAAEFTLDSLIHFRATQGTIGSTSAVTSQYGFAALGTMTGATNNYGFFGSLDSATGRWNLYMSGTARNYLAGDTSIGTTTGGYKLNVSGTANISGVLTGTTGTFSSTLTGTGLRSFAVNTGQTPSNNAGWYTLARFNTYSPYLNTNGNSGIITLTFYGGGLYTPSRFRIFYFKDDANIATLKLEKYGAVDYIQEVRIRYRTGDTRYYIEIYCDSHASGLTFDIHHDRLLGYGDQLELFGGVLDAVSGTGTILSNLSFVDHGTTVSNLRVESASSFTSSVTASSFVKSGGLTTQFLKADGTVDGTTYQEALTNPVTGTGTTNRIAYWNSVNSIAALDTTSYPSLTELSYVKGVTSAIQTQINGITANYVTTNTNQDITSIKTFKGDTGAAIYFRNTANTFIGALSTYKDWFSGGTSTDLALGAVNNLYLFSNNGSNWAVKIDTNRDAIFASKVKIDGGTSSQFLKANGDLDTNTYLTSYTETDTLASVTGRGASTATAITITASDSSIVVQSNGTGAGWRGRTVVKNSTANIATFLGNYNSRGGVFGHTNALDGWADLWVNTLGASGEGKVHLSNNTVIHSGDTEYAVLHAGNYTSYALPLNGNWTGNTGMNDQKLYLRTNGDNNHYLWNAADDYEELVYYTGTGFRVKGSTGTTSATFTDSGMSTVNFTGSGTDFYFGDWLSKRIKRFNVSGVDYKHKYILLMRVPTFGNVSVNCAVRGKLILERVNGIGIDVHDEFQTSVSYGNTTAHSMINKCNYGTKLVNYTHNGVAYLALYVYSAPNYAIGMLECNITDYGGWLDSNYGLVVELSSANHSAASYNRLDHRFGGPIIGGYDINSSAFTVLSENQLYRTGGGDLYINSSGTGHVRVAEGGGSLLINTGTRWNQEKLGVQISNSSNWSNVPAMMRLTNYGSGYITKITFTDSSIIDGWLGMIPINNGSYFVMGFSGATEEGFKVYQNGNVVAAGDVTAYSDVRIKENIVTIDNALEKTLALRGVYYNRIDTTDKRKKIGVIAQEVQKITPELVTKMEDGMLNVSYGNAVGLLIEAIKELAEENKQIKEELNKLKN